MVESSTCKSDRQRTRCDKGRMESGEVKTSLLSLTKDNTLRSSNVCLFPPRTKTELFHLLIATTFPPSLRIFWI